MLELLASEPSRASTADATLSNCPSVLARFAPCDCMPAVAAAVHAHSRIVGDDAIASVVVGVASPALLCGLESLIVSTRGMRLAASAQSVPELRNLFERAGASVALVDPYLGGHANVRVLLDTVRAAGPAIRCVLITDDLQPQLAREAVKAGVSGVVGASADTLEIRTALLEASRGRRYFAPAAAARLAESLTLEALTAREMDVLALLARGDCNKTIARVLGVTLGTVKTHVRAIMSKLDSRSRTEATLKACRLGLVGLHA